MPCRLPVPATRDGPPIFVVGTPRSGTTLLSEILDAHSRLAVSPETHYYNAFARDCEQVDCLQSADSRRAYVRKLVDSAAVEQMDLAEDVGEQILEALAEGEPSHRDVLDTLLSAYARARGADRWAEKTPRHLEWVPTIREDFPEARFVCVVRDARDVALSREAAGWSPSVWETVRDWRRHARLRSEFEDRWPEAFRTLRYEDLLEDPASELESLCPFLELGYEEEMLAFHETDSRTFEAEAEPWKQKATQPIDPSNKEKWRDRMPRRDRWIVEHLASEELRELGYPLVDPSPPPREMAGILASYARHAARWTVHEIRWFVDAKLLSPSYESPLDED